MKEPGWVTTEPLQAVLLRIIALHDNQPNAINGPLLALFAKRLVKHELKIGGPYSDGQQRNDTIINALIEHLFVAFESPLPNVTHYLHTHDSAGNSRKAIEVLVSECKQDMRISAKPIRRANQKPTASPAALHISDDLNILPLVMQPAARKVWNSVLKADHKHEISLLAQYFIESIQIPIAQPDSTASILGRANFYTWMAYTIYDDFIDQEGDPLKLPVANMAHRNAVQLYNDYTQKATEREITQHYFTEMDAANEWELTNARFAVTKQEVIITAIPDYKDGDILARRALGHILGPMLISRSTSKLTNSQRDQIYIGLKHYLVARQINDDLHDWVDDLRRGHISFVVAHLLRVNDIPKGPHSNDEVAERLKESFWKTELITLATIVVRHIDSAHIAFEGTKLFDTKGPLFKELIDPIKTSANQSIVIHREQKKFFKTYSK